MQKIAAVVTVSNAIGLINTIELSERAAYDLLYILTGKGTIRDYEGTHRMPGTPYPTTYKVTVIK